MVATRANLPASASREEVTAAVQGKPVVVLSGETGQGLVCTPNLTPIYTLSNPYIVLSAPWLPLWTPCVPLCTPYVSPCVPYLPLSTHI
jgi:hypothetical protein